MTPGRSCSTFRTTSRTPSGTSPGSSVPSGCSSGAPSTSGATPCRVPPRPTATWRSPSNVSTVARSPTGSTTTWLPATGWRWRGRRARSASGAATARSSASAVAAASRRSSRIAKCALASSGRRVRLLYANREPDSVIFDGTLRNLERRYPEQFEVHRHFDSVSGFPEPATIVDVVDGDLGADFYVCGPGPFMELAERTLLELGVGPGAILIERFETVVPGPPTLAGSPEDPLPTTVVLQVGAGATRSPTTPATRCSRPRGGRTCRCRSPARPATAPPAWPSSVRVRSRCG